MGLLDVFNSDEGRMALGLLAAAGPSSQPMSFGQRLAGAMSQHDAYLQHKQAAAAAAQDRALKQQMLQAQMADVRAQQQQREAQVAASRMAAEQNAKFARDYGGGAVTPQMALGAAQPDRPAAFNDGAFTPAQKNIGPTPQAAQVVGQRLPTDWNALLRAYPDKRKEITELMDAETKSKNFGLEEVARLVDTAGPNNMPIQRREDKFGRVIGGDIAKPVEMKLMDRGGALSSYNPFALQAGQEFKKTQTADGAASNAVAWARLAHDKQQAANSAAAGQLIETPEGYVRVSKDNRATAIMAPTGVQPLMGNGSKLPEAAQKQVLGARNVQQAVSDYQAKLATWSNSKMLSPDARAEMGNAYNNMMLQAKEAYNLGVLNGPDYAILQSVVKDPTKLTSIATSNEALSGQAGELSRIASNIEKNALNAHGKKYTPFAPNKPALTSGGVKFLGFE